MKVLVTGANGFVGQHVAKTLHAMNVEVVGASNQPELSDDLMGIVITYYGCDLTSPDEVSQIDLSGVDAIINLAGFAQIGTSFGQGALYEKVNVGVHTVLYDECLRQGVRPRIIAVSTGAVYDPDQPMPITEESRLIDEDKTNEYVISKQHMERALKAYSDKGLRVIVTRPLNHSGPGQMPGFLLPDLGEQLKDAVQQHTPLRVGNLQTKRDYTDVRDVAKAYATLATCEESMLQHDLYNICSGKSVEGTEILRLLTEAFGAENIAVEIDQSKIRPNDVMDIYGSYQRIHDDTGWQPTISVEQMVRDFAEWKMNQ